MIEGQGIQVKDRAIGTGFRIRSAIDNFGNSGIEDSAGAHRAGLHRHIERRFMETPTAESFAGLFDCFHFGMTESAFSFFPPVPAFAHNSAVLPDHHSANRHFAVRISLLGQAKGLFHIGFILVFFVHCYGHSFRLAKASFHAELGLVLRSEIAIAPMAKATKCV